MAGGIFLARYTPQDYPEPRANDARRIREYMTIKYKQRRWYQAPKVLRPPDEPPVDEFHQVRS